MDQVVLQITGVVQGVFYRAHAKTRAEALGLFGYAKNMPNGNVEVLAQGDKDKIQELVSWCKKGPDSASVESVKESWQTPSGIYTKFEIL